MKKIICGLLAAVTVLCFAGCDSIPLPGFEDYDISGHIEGLLDSSYLQDNSKYMEVTSLTAEGVAENNAMTVQNAATRFCNTFAVTPNAEQMISLKEVFSEAYRLSKYTVNEAEEVTTGYYIPVDITPLNNIRECTPAFDEAKKRIEDEYNQLSMAGLDDGMAESNNEDDDYFSDEDDYYDEDEDSGTIEDPATPPPIDYEAMNREILDEMIQIMKTSLLNPTYDEPTSITLDIRVEDNGDILLDTTQTDTIDETVVIIARK